MNKREFYIETPLGKLRVSAKHDIDTPEDFPGVYIDWIPVEIDNKWGEMICCVEYVPGDNRLQTCVYQPYRDEPVEIVSHEREG